MSLDLTVQDLGMALTTPFTMLLLLMEPTQLLQIHSTNDAAVGMKFGVQHSD